MIIARGIVAAAVLICWPLAARAYECTDEQREKSNAIFEEAKKAYRLAHFDEAIVLFSTGYEACADPMFLLNLGIAHKKLEQWEKAIHFYRSYLLEDPEAQDRERLGASIKEMERKLAEEKARAMPTPAGDPGPQPEPVAGGATAGAGDSSAAEPLSWVSALRSTFMRAHCATTPPTPSIREKRLGWNRRHQTMRLLGRCFSSPVAELSRSEL
jgi:tetratricopeptide (TPR) repeat protein